MKEYLIKITPLEPYTFGGEKGFTHKGVSNNGTYYMGSKEVPEQTTILGALRYLLLKSEGLLKSSADYSDDEKSRIGEICGENTFQFESDKKQSLGFIEKVSPLFILEKDKKIYIANPFCNIGKDGKLQLMKMTEGVECSLGNKISFPENSEFGYKAKEGYGNGYLCISDDKAAIVKKETDIFLKKQPISGNNGCQDEDGYFKREVVVMKEEFSFGVYVTLSNGANNIPKSNIIYMGKKNSAFRFDVIEGKSVGSLDQQVKDFFESCCIKDKWSYCLSDIYIKEISYNNFAIVETKKLRNLKTEYISGRFKRSRQERYEIIKAGSCFYGFQEIESNSNLNKFGYNHIIQMGGK